MKEKRNQTAKDRAAASITEKYGIDASTEGYCAATPAKWGEHSYIKASF